MFLVSFSLSSLVMSLALKTEDVLLTDLLSGYNNLIRPIGVGPNRMSREAKDMTFCKLTGIPSLNHKLV